MFPLHLQRETKAKFCKAFQDLIYGKEALENRFTAWVSFVEKEKLPNWTFPTYFLFIFHPDSEIFVKPLTTKCLLKFLDQNAAIGRQASWQFYSQIREIAAALREGLKTYGPRDMVDIQSLVWVAASVKADAVAAVISPGELIRLTEIRECLAVEAERIPALAIQSPNRSQPEPAAGNPRAARDYTIFQIDQHPFGTVL